MTAVDLRGFDYTLEPARLRAHQQVDVNIARLAERQRALLQAQHDESSLRSRYADLAVQFTPKQSAAIDPWRSMAAAQQLLQVRNRLSAAEANSHERQIEVNDARQQLDRARAEQEAFDTHRETALDEHRQSTSRREQNLADQEWLARQALGNSGPAQQTQRMLS